MNVDTRINLNMSQRLVMTPMLQQAIKLLQMSRLELVDLVKQEMLENPVLDEVEENADFSSPKSQEDQGGNQEKNSLNDAAAGKPESNEESEGSRDEQNLQGDSSVNWEEYFDDNPGGLGYYGEYDPDDANQTYDNLLSQSLSLTDHLSWQLQMSLLPERSMRIGTFLIGQIDDAGYVRCEEYASSPATKIHETPLKPKQLKEFRATVLRNLCQKINAAFEREYLENTLEVPEGIEKELTTVLLRDCYDELLGGEYETAVTKLRRLSLKDIESIVQLVADIPAAEIEALTGISAKEITHGIAMIQDVCQDLRRLIEQYLRVLLQESYSVKLEKMRLSSEKLYLVEYLLLQLSAEEIAYIASKEGTKRIDKYEKELHSFLERLQQSYAHVEQLTSNRYVLIQLYNVASALLTKTVNEIGQHRYQRLRVKLSPVTEKDVATVAHKIAELLDEYYQQETRVTCEEVEHILLHIQTFTPSGVGARDLKECLTIQVRSLGMADTPIEPIITTYFDELEQRQYGKIAEKLDISQEEVGLIQSIISNLSPKPGADFTSVRPEYIIPDIYVYKVDGEYEVVLNEDDLPNLRINPVYKKIITGRTHNVPNATRQYVDQKLRSAMWFIRSVEQRKRTIYKVGKSIVKFQRDFLEYGISHLKPLVLRDVADDISMHESTVSRVTTNKYIHTSQGVFELKYFFHSGLESATGEDVSSLAIKDKIKQMIEAEDSIRPLSDKAIEKQLKESGVEIARRTIAKYREELNIPSSIQRKRKNK